MSTVQDLLPEISRYVKNCPAITSLYALRRSVQEFCRESWTYEKTLLLTPVANQEVYHLDLTGEDQVIMVHHVQYNNIALQPRRGEDSLPSALSGGGNQPYEYIFEPPDILYLKPIPSNVTDPLTNKPYELLVRLILMPKDNIDTVPDSLYMHHKTQIAAGAAAFILSMPGEPWTNPQLSAKLETDFKYGYNEAKRQRLSGWTTKGFRVRPRSFLVQ